ncbi:LysR family transcriptional regulator [Pseudomonas sp. NPDC090201]|uniref:LysR family transcriptional regulator n=1 Tax=Pseudomonas sp. NPDC090201 TaxID=3364475 RepID=UPI0038211191
MELHQLRCFVAVAEELHFGRAAIRMHMTQPPLSRQVQLLERALGIQLFERNNRSVRLTTAGAGFLRDARHILAFSDQAADGARRLARGEAGSLTLGFTAVSAYQMIPQLLARAQEQLPGLQFTLREMVSSAQLEALAAHRIDVAFVRQINDADGLDGQLISREPLLVVLPHNHPLARETAIAVSALDQQPFVMYAPDEGRYFYDCIAGQFALSGVKPRYVYHLGQTHTVVSMVKAGLGLAIVPASAAQLHSEGLVFKPLLDAQLHAELYMVSRHDNDNPALPAFRRLVEGLN